jgi:hypothetical protein
LGDISGNIKKENQRLTKEEAVSALHPFVIMIYYIIIYNYKNCEFIMIKDLKL